MLVAEQSLELNEVEEEVEESGFEQQESQQKVEDLRLPESFFVEHVSRQLAQATEYLEIFFDGKDMHCGGPIPKKMLADPDYLTMVLNTDTSNGVLRAYEILAREGFGTIALEDEASSKADEQLAKDEVRLVLALLKECARLNIPKGYRGGILLIYLEICEGFNIKD